QRIGELLFEEKLFEDQTGTLYLVQSEHFKVWAHVFPKQKLKPLQQEAFGKLFQELKKTRHPLLNPILSAFVDREYIGITSEKPEGEPLLKQIQLEFPLSRIREWMIAISQALRILHQKSIFFPTLTPSHIYSSEAGLRLVQWESWYLSQKLQEFKEEKEIPSSSTQDIQNLVLFTYYLLTRKNLFGVVPDLWGNFSDVPLEFQPLFQDMKNYQNGADILDFFRKLKIEKDLIISALPENTAKPDSGMKSDSGIIEVIPIPIQEKSQPETSPQPSTTLSSEETLNLKPHFLEEESSALKMKSETRKSKRISKKTENFLPPSPSSAPTPTENSSNPIPELPGNLTPPIPLESSLKSPAEESPSKKKVDSRKSRKLIRKSSIPTPETTIDTFEIDMTLVKALPIRNNIELNQRLYKANKLLNKKEYGASLLAIYPAILSRPRHEVMIEFLETLQNYTDQLTSVEKLLLEASLVLGHQPLKSRVFFEQARVINPGGNLLQEALLRTYPENLTEAQKIAILQNLTPSSEGSPAEKSALPLSKKAISEEVKTISHEKSNLPEELQPIEKLLKEKNYSEALRMLYPFYVETPENLLLTPLLKTIQKSSEKLLRADQLFLDSIPLLQKNYNQVIEKYSQILEIEPGNMLAIQSLQKVSAKIQSSPKKTMSFNVVETQIDGKPLSGSATKAPTLVTQNTGYRTFTSEAKKQKIRVTRKYFKPETKKVKEDDSVKFIKSTAKDRAEAHIKKFKKSKKKIIFSQVKYSPIWLVSFLFHFILFSLFGFWLVLSKTIPEKPYFFKVGAYIRPVEIQKEEEEKKEEEKEATEETEETELTESEATASLGVVSDISKPFIAQGNSRGVHRKGKEKEKALDEFGGSASSEEAVQMGLNWLKQHQHPDGSWRALTFTENCLDTKCSGTADPNEYKDSDYDTAYTGLALLCYFGAGYSHQEKSDYGYELTIQKALDYLISNQLPEGYYGPLRRHEMSKKMRSCNMYVHGVSTLAMSEAYLLTRDPAIRRSLEKAYKFIEEFGSGL
ncbi:MAG: hypothetical protein AABZ60_03735, partial [Planctomycetota bacterium]